MVMLIFGGWNAPEHSSAQVLGYHPFKCSYGKLQTNWRIYLIIFTK